jgi:NAD(P)-dependent dehydrogenase (short-subunit alcohol dehydrogenase family)
LTLEGRTALVTGGAHGIGKAVALRLAQGGADLLVAFHSSRDEAEAVAAAARALGRRARTAQVDAERPAEVERLFADAAAFGGVDILVNAVGNFLLRTAFDTTPEEWSAVFRSNLDPMFLCSRAALPGMRERGWGRIVNFSAAPAGGAGSAPGMAAYMAAKAAVLSFTRGLALEEAAHGITVNAVAPGIIETRGAGPKVRANPERYVPMGRLGMVDEVAAAVAFLCAEESGYITGANLPVAGGYGL